MLKHKAARLPKAFVLAALMGIAGTASAFEITVASIAETSSKRVGDTVTVFGVVNNASGFDLATYLSNTITLNTSPGGYDAPHSGPSPSPDPMAAPEPVGSNSISAPPFILATFDVSGVAPNFGTYVYDEVLHYRDVVGLPVAAAGQIHFNVAPSVPEPAEGLLAALGLGGLALLRRRATN